MQLRVFGDERRRMLQMRVVLGEGRQGVEEVSGFVVFEETERWLRRKTIVALGEL